MHNPSVYIVLLNYNGCKDTVDCIQSLKQIDYNNYKIIVVDNDSQDNSKEILKKVDDIILIESDSNLGFSGGNNLGIKYALNNNADYICLLNNDTIVEKDFLDPLVDEMEKDSSIGISAGKIMYYDNKDIIWSAGGYIDEFKAIGNNYGIDEKESNLNDYSGEVTFLTGCLQLIRRDVLEKIGLYDHEYFLYMEDVDFCKRTLDAGYKLKYVPESKIYHKVSAATGGECSPTVIYYMTRNRLLFNSKYQKNILKKLLFYIFFTVKIILEPIRKNINPKYVKYAIGDFFKKEFGYRDLRK